MQRISFWMLILLSFCSTINAFAQRGGGVEDDDFLPGAIYEIRYWTNMAAVGLDAVQIDTMIFHGNDRAVFEYSSSNCVSYGCRQSDSLVYVLLPKFMSSSEKEWVMGENFVRKMYRVGSNFRGHDRQVYKVFITDMVDKGTGRGDYVFVTRNFGIIYRYNSDGEIFMLNRIDVLKDGKTVDEIDLLPLHMKLQSSDIFTGTN